MANEGRARVKRKASLQGNAGPTPTPPAKPETSPPGRLQRMLQTVQLFQGAATAVALLAGAWWFMEQRQTYPHAQLEQTVEVVPVAKGLVAVEVRVQFSNTGKLLIHLTHATVKLQQVTADYYDYPKLALETGDAYWLAKRPAQPGQPPMKDPRQFNQGELRWPVLNQFDGRIEHLVEPGETDVLVFTFLTPCLADPADPASALHMVRVASDIHKPARNNKNDFAWKTRAFADVSAACQGKGPEHET
jgi:hypothetical protein